MKFTREELKEAQAILRETNRLLQRPKELRERRAAQQPRARKRAPSTRPMNTGKGVIRQIRTVQADLISGKQSPDTCRILCRALGTMLKIVALELKYGPIRFAD